MDERVLGDMPSEGSDGGRRFGIYRAHSPDPKMYRISRMRVLFVAAVAAVVSFAVFFPMIQYVSRINKKNLYYPYSELANLSIFKQDENVIPPIMNCSSNIFTFGHDCSDDNVQTNLNTTDDSLRNDTESTTIGLDDYSSTISETTTQPNADDDMSGIKPERIGRSRQPVVSTPYPYYNLPKPTPSLTDRKFEDFSLPMTPIFAIPLDVERETFTEYRPLKPMVNFTPPPYAFTPLPKFTDRYAQLSPYKVPNGSSNFEDVMKFLKNNESSNENKTAETQTGSNSRITTMKVKGTYTMPLDDVDDSAETVTFYNGHAYVSDPFVKFRPSHPLDINRLMPARPGLEVNPRFRRPYPIIPGVYREHDPSGSHTVAIFHPPSLSSPRPLSMPRPLTSSPKPLTVTLDIYPVTMDINQDQGSGLSTTFPGRERGRLNPKWRPRTTERPRWRPPGPRRPLIDSNRQSPDNHMIVHLNLFPNKRKPYTFLRRSKPESSTESEQTTVIGGEQFQARNSLERPSDHSSTEAMDRTTSLPLTSSTGGERQFTITVGTPENSALPSNNEKDNVEEYDDNMTTIADNLLTLDNEHLEDGNDTFVEKPGEGDEYDLVDTIESSGANSLEDEYDLSDYTEEQVEDATEQQGMSEVEGIDYELTTDSGLDEPLIKSSIPS